MGKADVAHHELVVGLGDLHRRQRPADQVAGDAQNGNGEGVDPVPQAHRRLVDIDRGAAADRLEVFERGVTCQARRLEDLVRFPRGLKDLVVHPLTPRAWQGRPPQSLLV